MAETRTGKQFLKLAGADPKESGGLAESRSPRAQLHGGMISWHRDSGNAPTAKAKNFRLIACIAYPLWGRGLFNRQHTREGN